MSLILDALNRSATERNGPDAVPGIQTVHDAPREASAPLWRRMPWPALALVLVAIAAGLWLAGRYYPGDPTPGRHPSAKAGAPARSAPESAAGGKDPVETATSGTAAVATAAGDGMAATASAVTTPAGSAPGAPSPGAAVNRNEPSSGPAAERSNRQVASPPTPPRALDPDVAALYAHQSDPAVASQAQRVVESRTDPAATQLPAPAPVKEAVTARSELDVDTLALAAERALADRRQDHAPVVEHEAPFIVELRQTLKDQIPSIFYSSHRWASSPGQRSVVLNGEVRRAGQQIKPGLRLVEILEDSIVLEFQGTEFRLRSLNSWVNL